MAWYETGTISVTNGSTTVTGSGTDFLAGAQVGEALYAPDGRFYEISAIVSATEITLRNNYLGSTQSGQSYTIVPTQSLVADLADSVSSLITDYQTVKDEAGSGKFADGTASSPGITFLQDQNNGLARLGTDRIGIVTAGSTKIDIDATGVNADVLYKDSIKQKFGTGSDLQIHHDGTDAYITNTTGEIKISGNVDIQNNLNNINVTGGISFDGGTNYLDDYEEGTWTPTAAAYSGVMTVTAARYTKIGRICYASASVTFDGTADASTVNLQSVPFTPKSTIIEGGFITRNTTGVDFHLDLGGTNSIRFRDPATNADRTYTQMSTGTVHFTLIYTVA